MPEASAIPARTFHVPISPDQSIDVKISEPDLRADNLTLTTWTSSLILASQLYKIDVNFKDNTEIDILELGAGTGLVGLTASILWQKKVVLTDLHPIILGLEANIALNDSEIRKGCGTVQCGSLDWCRPETLTLLSGRSLNASGNKAGVILAADTVYSEEHPELLSKAILTWLAPGSSSTAILTYPLRVAYLDFIRELWEMLENGGLEAVSEGKERGVEDDWDDECLCEWSVWKWKSP